MLTFSISTFCDSFTAALICRLFALISVIKTSVLESSMSFIDDSVLSGYLRTDCLSRALLDGILLVGYFGFLGKLSVLGL